MSITESTRRTVNIPEAAKLLGISRGAAYEAARSGELAGVPVIKVGQRLVIPRKPLEDLLGIATTEETDHEAQIT